MRVIPLQRTGALALLASRPLSGAFAGQRGGLWRCLLTDVVSKVRVHAAGVRTLLATVAGLTGLLVYAAIAEAQVASGPSPWLLWHHTHMTRAPKDVKPSEFMRYVIQNDWVIVNAVETRDQCRTLLREEFSKRRSFMAEHMVDPGGSVNHSPLGDGVKASLWSGKDIRFGQSGIEMRLGMQQDFWCLPAAVDPRNIRINLLDQQ